MKRILGICNQSYYHRFGIRLIAAGDVIFDAWVGAVIRNNLLYVTDNNMPLAGHVNKQCYNGKTEIYFPLLRFMAEIGVWDEIIYGMKNMK